MTYTTTARAFISITNRMYLQVVQNKVLQIIGKYDFNIPTAQLSSDKDIPTLGTHIKILTQRLYESAKKAEIHVSAL